MAEDASGAGLLSEKKYVAGWVTRHAVESSNALRVTQPATYCGLGNPQFSVFCIFNILCFVSEVWQELEEVERDRQPL